MSRTWTTLFDTKAVPLGRVNKDGLVTDMIELEQSDEAAHSEWNQFRVVGE